MTPFMTPFMVSAVFQELLWDPT